jgi:hypothetical protein
MSIEEPGDSQGSDSIMIHRGFLVLDSGSAHFSPGQANF